MHNKAFKPLEFDTFKKTAGVNVFTFSIKKSEYSGIDTGSIFFDYFEEN